MLTIRRKQLFNRMEDNSFACFFSGKAPIRTADQHYHFEVNRNFYYLTNINQDDLILAMFKGAGYEKTFLFIEQTDPVMALWVGEGLSKEEAKNIALVDEVYDRKDFETIIARYLTDSRAAIFGDIKYLYLDLERRDFNQVQSDSGMFANQMKHLYPNLIVGNIHKDLSELRSIKDSSEVEQIKAAIEITREGIERLMQQSKPGLYEYQLQAHYNFVLNSHGVKNSFTTIAAGGKNATILHYEKNNQMLLDDNLVLFDLGVEKDLYCSDISRTFPVNGKFTARQKEIYEIVLEANKKSIAMLKSGVTFQQFNEFGKQVLAEGLIRIGKIKDESEISKYYYHSLGHFLGLDVHDVGNYTKPFEKGQILTVEPGLYIADEHIGIRIEDNILLTEDGHINLSESIIKEIKDIEAFMAKK